MRITSTYPEDPTRVSIQISDTEMETWDVEPTLILKTKNHGQIQLVEPILVLKNKQKHWRPKQSSYARFWYPVEDAKKETP